MPSYRITRLRLVPVVDVYWRETADEALTLSKRLTAENNGPVHVERKPYRRIPGDYPAKTPPSRPAKKRSKP